MRVFRTLVVLCDVLLLPIVGGIFLDRPGGYAFMLVLAVTILVLLNVYVILRSKPQKDSLLAIYGKWKWDLEQKRIQELEASIENGDGPKNGDQP